MNVFIIILDSFQAILNLTGVVADILFFEFTIGTITFSMWAVLGGAGLLALITAWFVKKIVPVA